MDDSKKTRLFRRPAIAVIVVLLLTGIVSWRFPAPSSPVIAASQATAPAGYSLAYNTADFKSDVVYEVLLDRFFEGNPNKTIPSSDTAPMDPTHQNWKAYWGGDLQGLTDQVPYIANMGVTAIWILPPVQNITQPADYANSAPQAGYHGYWATDDYQIDPHLGTWADFDNFVAAAHQHGIKVIVDFAPNHSNPNDVANMGNIYENGVLQANYANDTNGWFHHNSGIQDYNNLYQDEYYNLADLADLAQENPAVDSYLKGAIYNFLQHGVDGVRIDAVKHMPGPTGAWGSTLADSINSTGAHYLVGEWYLSSISDPTYSSAVRYANNSGIALLNFPVNTALRDVYANNGNAAEMDSVLTQEQGNFTWLNDQGVFIDNHDMSRFQTVVCQRIGESTCSQTPDPSELAVNEGLAVSLTVPGIPIVYYGDEQYLHNDTSGGGDPYNRPMMSGFSQTTPAYQIIQALAALRHSNPALGYGTYQQRWINNDVYIFERQFYNSVVVIAVNKNTTTGYNISGLYTNLPSGQYSDVLNGIQGGGAITVGNSGSGSNNPVSQFTLQPNEISVWQYTAQQPASPEIGSVAPELVHSGDTAYIDGQGLGSINSVTYTIGSSHYSAAISNVSQNSVQVVVPSVPLGSGGLASVQVCGSAGCSNSFSERIASAHLVPVTFTVYNAQPTNSGDNIYLTGSVSQLGSWSANSATAIGPMITYQGLYPTWFVMASVPACSTIQFKFIDIQQSGSVIWESGPNHTYTAPCYGDGYDNVNWQYTSSSSDPVFYSTSTAITSAPSGSSSGQSVTLTAYVQSSNGNVPTGDVVFEDGSQELGAGIINSSGYATITTQMLEIGTDTVTAAYDGDLSDQTSISSGVGITVSP